MSARPNACESQKAHLLAALERGVPLPVELHAHALSCAGCRAALARWSAQGRVLRALPRVPAPSELDGRVVAAFHAGVRQTRALDQVQSLSRVPVPSELDARMARMLAGAHTSSARFERGESDGRRAPSELDQRVERDLQALLAVKQTRQTTRAWAAFAVASLAMVTAWLVWPRTQAVPTLQPEIELVQVRSLRELDPLSRGLLDSVSGGALSAGGKL
jgi:hypothetical protein